MKFLLFITLLITITLGLTFSQGDHTKANENPIIVETSITINGEEYIKLGKAGDYILYKKAGDFFTAQALEKVYEDSDYTYYLPSIESHLYILVKGNERIGIKEALKTGEVTINELMKSPLKIYKHSNKSL